MIKIDVHATYAVVREQKPLTVGLVGSRVRFSFGEDWDGLVKTAVFRQGEVTVDAVNVSGESVLPWEVLTRSGLPVQIGICGMNADGTVVIPTLWAETEPVQPGADPSGDTSAAAALPVYQQILAQIGPLDQLDSGAKDTLVAAINEANRQVQLFTVLEDSEGRPYIREGLTFSQLQELQEQGKTLLSYWYSANALLYLVNYQPGTAYVFAAMMDRTQYQIVVRETGLTYTKTDMSRLPNPEKLTFEGAVSATYDGSSPVVVNIPKAGSGVHVGSEPPADPSVNVWIDPEGGDGDLDFTIPDALPNPHKLTFTGAVTGEYDGSQAVTVALPEVMTVELTESNGTYTANKTQQEILEAYNAGQEVRCIYGAMVLPLVQCTVGFCAFACVYNTSLYSVVIRATDNSVTLTVTDASAGGNADTAAGSSVHAQIEITEAVKGFSLSQMNGQAFCFKNFRVAAVVVGGSESSNTWLNFKVNGVGVGSAQYMIQSGSTRYTSFEASYIPTDDTSGAVLCECRSSSKRGNNDVRVGFSWQAVNGNGITSFDIAMGDNSLTFEPGTVFYIYGEG